MSDADPRLAEAIALARAGDHAAYGRKLADIALYPFKHFAVTIEPYDPDSTP